MPTTPKRTAAKPRLVAPDDLYKFIGVSDPQLSPSGANVAFVRKHVNPDKNEYITNIWMVPTVRGAEPRQFTTGNKDTQPRFSADGATLAFVSAREKTKPQIFLLNAIGGEATALTKFPEGAIGTIRWSPDGSMIAASFRETDPQWTEDAKKKRKDNGQSDPPRVIDDWWYRLDGDGYFNAQRYCLYLIDVATGEHRCLYAKDNMGGFTFDFSPDSRELVIASNRDRKAMIRPWKDELLRLNIATGKITPIPNLPEGPKTHPTYSPDGRHIAYAGRVGRDGLYSVENLELWVCDPKTGNARILTGKSDYCLMAPALSDSSEVKFDANFVWSHDSKRIYMQIGWHGEQHIASVPVTARSGGTVKFHTHGRRAHTLGSISSDGRRLAFTMGTATRLDEVYVSCTSPSDVFALTDFNGPLFKHLRLAPLEGAWIKSSDGARVQTWVIRPPHVKKSKRMPAVLEIHGGPHAQYGVGYFHEFQCLAAQGYTVFYSNPRGSKGYGRDHCAAIRGDWGNKDWEDIQAVTRFMQKQKFVNPRRIGIMGGSYGGYMTNWAIAHTHDFRAAITDRCVANLISMFGNSDYVDEPDRYWKGTPWNNPQELWRQSPIAHFKDVKTPTLIIHSEGDLRCNVEQGEQVFAALNLLDVPTRLVRYPNSTSHGMSRSGPPDMRLHRLGQIIDWWKRWLRG
jgi:dipeptidyl aminopeptidase/acylaminoacyl peptidase